MAIKHILIAIDGTGSREWIRENDGLNSHVYRFCKDFYDGVDPIKGDKKKIYLGPEAPNCKYYIHGPGTLGEDVREILDYATEKLCIAIMHALRNGANSLSEVKVNIIGHSRGAFIALKLANRLEKPMEFLRITQSGSDQRVAFLMNTIGTALPHIRVNFLGLYDTVQRTANEFSADLTLQNVDRVAHAIRARGRTRVSFGGIDVPNSITNFEIDSLDNGTKVDIPKCIQTPELDTSHGGIGGDPGFFSPIRMLFKDPYCNALHLVGAADSVSFDGKVYGSYAAWKYGGAIQNTIDDIERYWKASSNADEFMRTYAKFQNVPFRDVSDHLPYSNDELGLRLKSLIRLKYFKHNWLMA
jgi:pimeloyl-ACP methyl ester carboxylesterase